MKANSKINIVVANVVNTFAAIMGVCTVFNIYRSYKYIDGLIIQGLDIKKEYIEVINYYITSIVPYVFYTLCLIALAVIIRQNNSKVKNIVESNECNRVIAEEGLKDDEVDLVDELLRDLD